MKSLLYYYLKFIILFLGIQMIFNILFLIIYSGLAADVGAGDRLMALVIGLKLDISLTGYILGLPTLLLLFYSILQLKIIRKILGVYTFIVIICLILAYFTNLVVYKYWNYPIDKSIFDYISTPGEMLASLPVWTTIVLFSLIGLIVYGLHFQLYKRWVARSLEIRRKKYWASSAVFLILLPALILPIRGGTDTSPIQVGSVYFHQNTFINHAAVNPVWNLVYTMVEGDKMVQSADYCSMDDANRFMKELYGETHEPASVLTTSRPNIILIFLESFSQPVIEALGGSAEAAPNLNALVKEGIFFNNYFATGTMTDRALGAILCGYPSVPGTCIIYYEKKVEKLPMLPRALESAGYNSTFLYGGDIDFAHINSLLVSTGFDRIIHEKHFPQSIARSNWGVPDHHLFEELLKTTNEAPGPFFHVLLTLSSHTPFDVPMEPVFPVSTRMDKYLNSVYYTDQALGKFMDEAKTADWWDSTLVIITADHGFRVSNFTSFDTRRFNIPMLWLGGALSVKDTLINNYGSQTDLPITVLNQLGLPADDFQFSRDLFAPAAGSFAYYTYNEGIVFISDSTRTNYNFVTKEFHGGESWNNVEGLNPGLAYLQYLITDFNGY